MRGSTLAHQQRLKRPAERAALVVNRRIGEPNAGRLRDRDRFEADPLPGRQGDAPDLPGRLGVSRARAALERPGDQGGRRPGMLGVGVPRPPRELG